jgi:hypothetical protein
MEKLVSRIFNRKMLKTFSVIVIVIWGFNGVKSQQIDTSNYAIIMWQKSDHLLFNNATSTTLSKQEIELTERILHKAVEKHNRKEKNQFYKTLSLSLYYRQYVPVINSKGQKEVWVNCIGTKPENYWRKEIQIVYDGGNYYFNVKINLSTGEFYQFSVNGFP